MMTNKWEKYYSIKKKGDTISHKTSASSIQTLCGKGFKGNDWQPNQPEYVFCEECINIWESLPDKVEEFDSEID